MLRIRQQSAPPTSVAKNPDEKAEKRGIAECVDKYFHGEQRLLQPFLFEPEVESLVDYLAQLTGPLLEKVLVTKLHLGPACGQKGPKLSYCC